MQIVTRGVAGTMESSDVIVRIEPARQEGVSLTLTSAVMQQFGKQIEKVIRDTLAELRVTSAEVDVVDKGALDCTIAARVRAAAYRAAKSEAYAWGTKE